MKTALQILEAIALLALALLLGEAAWTIHRIRPKLEVTISNIDRTVIVAGAAATHLEKAAGTWEQASKAQASETSQAMSNVSAAAAQLSQFVLRTDDSVNSKLLPAITTAVEHQDVSLSRLQKSLDGAVVQMGQATVEAQKVLADTDEKINSPDIQKTLDSAALSAQHLADATDQAAKTMTAVRSGVEYEVAQIEKPVTKIKVVFLFILTALGKFFGY